MMTMFQRIMRAVKSQSGRHSNFDNYYSKLLATRVGETGLPSAREAQRDLANALRHPLYYNQR
jgi:hypothetical protein